MNRMKIVLWLTDDLILVPRSNYSLLQLADVVQGGQDKSLHVRLNVSEVNADVSLVEVICLGRDA